VQLQMLALVASTSYVTTGQAQQLLRTFNPKVSQQEADRAGMLLHMAAIDPLDYWPDVLPHLEPSVQAHMLGLARTSGVLDLANPTNLCAAGAYAKAHKLGPALKGHTLCILLQAHMLGPAAQRSLRLAADRGIIMLHSEHAGSSSYRRTVTSWGGFCGGRAQ
jgi:hypothetical protein